MKINITQRTSRLLRYLTAGALALGLTATAHAQGTAFTYQGRLTDGVNPATGIYDLSFTLYDSAGEAGTVGSPVPKFGVGVTNGLFTVALDFGAGLFNGAARWLEIAAKTNGASTYVTLAPRQPLTPTPYAVYAPNAGTAASSSAVAPGTVTGSGIANGQVVRSLNGLQDALRLLPGTNVSVSSAGDAITISATPGTVVTNAGWGISGNAGTTTRDNFLGTTDGQALQLRVNNARALRLEPGTDSPNLIGGPVNNSVLAGVEGATIAGGGNRLFPHEVKADYGTVGGGVANSVGATVGVIAGGSGNSILTNASFGTISGGAANTVQGYASFIGGGRNNRTGLGTYDSVIGGGYINTNNAYRSALLGGQQNIVRTNSDYAFLGGGLRNDVDGDASSILGGRYNSARGLAAVVLGGESNRITADAAFLGGGQNNTNSGLHAVLAGGWLNRIESSANQAFIGGGHSNVMQGASSVIVGGERNTVESGINFASIGGGLGNNLAGHYATISGGNGNQADGMFATIPGGNLNRADAMHSFAAGNRAKALHTGSFVWADSTYADFASTAANQFLIRAASAGINTTSPQATLDIVTQNREQFALRLQNTAADGWASIKMADGAGHSSSIGFNYGDLIDPGRLLPTIGFYTPSGACLVLSDNPNWGGNGYAYCSTTFVCLSLTETSDRSTKANIEPITPSDILERVVALPISTWSFTNAVNTRHIGPMAQDFHAAFGMGDNNKTIGPRDANGVALAAIQGLNQKLQEELGSVRADNAALKARLDRLEQLINTRNGGGQ